MYDLLRGKIASRSLHVAVIGLGYVGLSLATAFAEAGFQVIGIDTDRQKVEQVNRGESYIVARYSNSLMHNACIVPVTTRHWNTSMRSAFACLPL